MQPVTIDRKIETYLEGWRLGDGALSLGATAPDFHYDDPNTGRIDRAGFVEFVEDFKTAVRALNAGVLADPFLEYTDIVIRKQANTATVWCWWRARGTEFQGSALIKVADIGVLSERIAYFSRLPE